MFRYYLNVTHLDIMTFITEATGFSKVKMTQLDTFGMDKAGLLTFWSGKKDEIFGCENLSARMEAQRCNIGMLISIFVENSDQ